jgi:hypothetical protein
MKRSVKWAVIGVSVVLTLIIGLLVYRGYQNTQLKNERLNQLIKQADERSKKENSTKPRVNLGQHVKKSKLNEKDLDLTQRFDQFDVENHAKIILGIINEKTRLKAIKDLPLTDDAMQKYFGRGNDNIYYGRYTKDVNVDILFAGLDYSKTSDDYNADVIANVTYYGDNAQTDSEVVSLTIHYKGLEIDGWDY